MLNVGLLSKLGDTKVVPTPCIVVFTLVHPAGATLPVELSTFSPPTVS